MYQHECELVTRMLITINHDLTQGVMPPLLNCHQKCNILLGVPQLFEWPLDTSVKGHEHEIMKVSTKVFIGGVHLFY